MFSLEGCRLEMLYLDPDPFVSKKQCYAVDLDPDSMGSRDPCPDPGGQKWPANIEKLTKFHILKCWMFSFEG